jgi:chromosome segregation ATPase
MSQASPSPLRARLADHALLAYLSPLFAGRRIAVVGTSSGDVAHRARALGAHTVISFGGVAEDIAVRALTPGAIAAFHGKLDVIVVPDATAVPSLVAVLDEARRALGSDGILVVGAEPEDAPVPMEVSGRSSPMGFSQLHELCAARFGEVRMVGRGPFVGYTLATLDEAAEGVALDTRLVDGDPPKPEAFIAVASDSAVALEALAVVQVAPEVLHTLRASARGDLEAKVAERDQKLKDVEQASAERWVKLQRLEHGLKELEDEHRKARDKAVRLQKELEDERKLRQRIELDAQMTRRAPELPKGPDLQPELDRVKSSLAGTEARAASLAADLAAAQARVTAAESALEESKARVKALGADVMNVEAALDAALKREGDLQRELDETQATEAELREQLDELAARPEPAPVVVAAPVVAAPVVTAPVAKSDGPTRQEFEALRTALEAERAARAQAEAEFQRVETLLAERATELRRADELHRLAVEAARELSLTAQRGGLPAEELASLRAGLGEAQRARAQVADERDALEAQLVAVAGEAQQLRWKLAEAAATASSPDLSPPDLAAWEVKEARYEGMLRGLSARVRECEALLVDLDRALAEERAGREQDRALLLDARNEVSRLYALNVSLEGRTLQRGVELEGAREGFQRRVAELELEVERLVQALSVSGTQATEELSASLTARANAHDLVMAEAQGLRMRLDEAERSLSRPRAAAPAAVDTSALEAEIAGLKSALSDAQEGAEELQGVQFRLDRAMRDLEATARRLAETEETLGNARSESVVLRARGGREDSLRGAVEGARRGISGLLADGRGALLAPELMGILRALEVD